LWLQAKERTLNVLGLIAFATEGAGAPEGIALASVADALLDAIRGRLLFFFSNSVIENVLIVFVCIFRCCFFAERIHHTSCMAYDGCRTSE
jgi:hypothetical protein